MLPVSRSPSKAAVVWVPAPCPKATEIFVKTRTEIGKQQASAAWLSKVTLPRLPLQQTLSILAASFYAKSFDEDDDPLILIELTYY